MRYLFCVLSQPSTLISECSAVSRAHINTLTPFEEPLPLKWDILCFVYTILFRVCSVLMQICVRQLGSSEHAITIEMRFPDIVVVARSSTLAWGHALSRVRCSVCHEKCASLPCGTEYVYLYLFIAYIYMHTYFELCLHVSAACISLHNTTIILLLP